MDEVSGELDDDVTKQGLLSEPLPEPLLIILSPPPPFLSVPGDPPMFWPKWLKAFENYMEGLGESDLIDSSKCLLLKNCLGAEGQRIFTTLVQSGSTYAAAVSLLTLFFCSDHASQMYRLHFHQRAQLPGESAEAYVSALEELLTFCHYGDLRDKLILDQLVGNTSCPPLKERLLSERETLTLDKALVIAKEVEFTLTHSEAFGVHEVSVAIGDDVDPPVVKRKRGRPRRDEVRPKTRRRSTKIPTRSRRKYSYRNNREKLCHSEEKEDEAEREAGKEDEGDPSSLQRTEKEDDTSEEVEEEDEEDDDDKDDDYYPFELKGPHCPICKDKCFKDGHTLARHMRTHTKEKPYSCPLCAVTFSQSYHMTRHVRNQHGGGPHICSVCGESSESFAELQRHKNTHSLSCPDCDETFTNNDAFCRHVRSHGKTSQSSRNRNTQGGEDRVAEDDVDSDGKEPRAEVKTEDADANGAKTQDGGGGQEDAAARPQTKGHFCPICVGRRFRGKNKLARHMRTHTKEKPFSCPVCAMTFSQSYHMTRHLRKQHGLARYICGKCGTISGSWLELKAHKRTHASESLICLACDRQFQEKAELVNHLKVHKKVQAGSRSLVCGDCGKVFGRLYHLKRHIVTHRKAANGDVFKCPNCHKKFAFPEDLNKHMETHVRESQGACPKCKETFSCPEELEAHMSVHAKSYACATCGKKFKVEYALKKHEQGHQNDQYYCSLCRKRFAKLSHYKRHLLVHNRRESRCPHCDCVFLQLTALKYHLRMHTHERPYQCTCCIETFEEEEDLLQHRLKHRKFKKERPYSCTRCDSAFSTLVELTDHMASHESEQPMNCPDCGRTFLNKNKLEKHMSIHSGERPHLCSICGNGFPSAASLKLHAHIHTGEKPFQCSQCSKSFRSSSGLRLHSRQHMAVRPSYECPECGRTYGRMTELRMHQRYHTGDKPYACTCCSKRFISKDKLNVHMRIHTGERPYSCPHCGQTFTQTGDRNRHVSKYH